MVPAEFAERKDFPFVPVFRVFAVVEPEPDPVVVSIEAEPGPIYGNLVADGHHIPVEIAV